MINVIMQVDKNSCIKMIKANGHASGSCKGNNVLCSAFTMLLRTSVRTISANPSIKCTAKAGKEGELELVVKKADENKKEWLKGLTDNILQGLNDLKIEYPDEMNIVIRQ